MNIFKKLFLLISVAFLVSGCNVYRQMVIPTPYTPAGVEEYKPTTNRSTSINSEIVEDSVTPPDKSVNETLNTEGTFSPARENKVVTKDRSVVQRIPFPEAEYRSLATSGSGVIKGRIYIINASGEKIYGRNTRLYLNPVTSYSTQWYQESYLGGAKMSKVDNRLFNYLKFTTSDSNGNFEFLNVPSGSYYLIGVVKCGTACGYDRVKNIRIAKKVSILGNEVKEVELFKKVQ